MCANSTIRASVSILVLLLGSAVLPEPGLLPVRDCVFSISASSHRTTLYSLSEPGLPFPTNSQQQEIGSWAPVPHGVRGRHRRHWESLAQGGWPWLVTDAFPLYLTQNAVSTGEEKPGERESGRMEPDPVSGHDPHYCSSPCFLPPGVTRTSPCC